MPEVGQIYNQVMPIVRRARAGRSTESDPMVRFDVQNHALLQFQDTYCSIDLSPSVKDQNLSSVINLVQEVDLHSRLIARAVLNLHDQPCGDVLIAELLRNCRFDQDAELAKLRQVIDGQSEIDLVAVNTQLDALRDSLYAQAEAQVTQRLAAYFSHQGLRFNCPSSAALHEALCSTTALAGDYFHTDNFLHQAVLITASEKTSQSKKLGRHELALRVIDRYEMNDHALGMRFLQCDIRRVEMLVPSLVATDAADVTHKLDAIVMRMVQESSARVGEFMVYSLHTSLRYYTLMDYWDNHQSRAADLAFKGAHDINQRNLNQCCDYEKHAQELLERRTKLLSAMTEEIDPKKIESSLRRASTLKSKSIQVLRVLDAFEGRPLVLLQNLPVNQHSDALDLTSSHTTISEAALMATMSLVYTIAEQLKYHHNALGPRECRELVSLKANFYQAYRQFLMTRHCDLLFSQSDAGKGLINALVSSRDEVISYVEYNPDRMVCLDSVVARTLYMILVHRMYLGESGLKFGALIQSLSVYVQKKSLSGCQTAHERWQMVAGRVTMLTAMRAKLDWSVRERSLARALVEFCQHCQRRLSNISLQPISSALDELYNDYGLYGSASAACQIDTGASSGVQSYGGEWHTDYAEIGVPAWQQAHAKPHQSVSIAVRLHKQLSHLVVTVDAAAEPLKPVRHSLSEVVGAIANLSVVTDGRSTSPLSSSGSVEELDAEQEAEEEQGARYYIGPAERCLL